MYFLTDDIDEPDFLVLKAADRFHCIRHSGEIRLTDGVTMTLLIFVVWRDTTGLFDMQILNKFFRPDGLTNETLMSKKGIPAAEVEEVVANTCSKFGAGLEPHRGSGIEWDELDLRGVMRREEQLKRLKKWGKLRNIRVGE